MRGLRAESGSDFRVQCRSGNRPNHSFLPLRTVSGALSTTLTHRWASEGGDDLISVTFYLPVGGGLVEVSLFPGLCAELEEGDTGS